GLKRSRKSVAEFRTELRRRQGRRSLAEGAAQYRHIRSRADPVVIKITQEPLAGAGFAEVVTDDAHILPIDHAVQVGIGASGQLDQDRRGTDVLPAKGAVRAR